MGLPFGGAFLFAAVPVLCWFGLRRVIVRSQIFEKFRAGTSLWLLLLTNALRSIAPRILSLNNHRACSDPVICVRMVLCAETTAFIVI